METDRRQSSRPPRKRLEHRTSCENVPVVDLPSENFPAQDTLPGMNDAGTSDVNGNSLGDRSYIAARYIHGN